MVHGGSQWEGSALCWGAGHREPANVSAQDTNPSWLFQAEVGNLALEVHIRATPDVLARAGVEGASRLGLADNRRC